jgi:glutathione S-transferase
VIKLHHSRRTRSARVIWLLEELGVPYELELVDFKPEALKAPEHLKLHPLGQLPVLQDDGVTMFESGAILEYLLEKYGQGRLAPAPGTPQRAEYLQWFHYGEASLARYVSDIVRVRFREPQVSESEAMVARSRARFAEALTVVDRALAGRDYICGATFTAADIMIGYVVALAKIIRELPPGFANLEAYLERLKQRPVYERVWS